MKSKCTFQNIGFRTSQIYDTMIFLKKLKKSIAFFIGALAMLASLESDADIQIEPIQSPLNGKATAQYRVPYAIGSPLNTANTINTWVQYLWLNSIAGHSKISPFEHLDGMVGLVGLNYKLAAKTPSLLTIAFEAAYMDAYPSDAISRMTFELHGGQPIQLTDLLTAEGAEKLNKKFIEYQSSKIEKFLPTSMRDRSSEGGAQKSEFDVQSDAYTECRAHLKQSTLEHVQFTVSEGKITLFRACDFPHNIKALEDLDEIPYNQSVSNIETHLNTYGRCVLIENKTDCKLASNTLHDGIYRGELGGRAITLLLSQHDSTPIYYFDDEGTPIELSFTQDPDNSIHIESFLDEEHKRPHQSFSLTLDDADELIGSWQQEGGMQLPVKLHQ